jgi:hypothetical protein
MILEFTTNISLQVMGFAIVIIGCVCIIFGAVGSSVDAISLLINKKLK